MFLYPVSSTNLNLPVSVETDDRRLSTVEQLNSRPRYNVFLLTVIKI